MIASSFQIDITGGHLVGESHASCGIDVQAPGPAPGRELVRVDIRLDGPDTSCIEVLERILGLFQPRQKKMERFIAALQETYRPKHFGVEDKMIQATTAPTATWRSVSRVNDGKIIIEFTVDGKPNRFSLPVQDAFQIADSIFQFLAINAGLAPASTLTQSQAHPCETCPMRNALLNAYAHPQQQDQEIRNCQGPLLQCQADSSGSTPDNGSRTFQTEFSETT